MILEVIKQIFCEMLVGGRKPFYTEMFFEVTNIRGGNQHDFSEFGGLLHKIVTKKPFMSQEICYINGNGKIKLCTVYA